ncbi:MAG: hypothetical protein GTO45_30100 [Candidatus Aminicenantes bacterium]|nr:hypothetical protein [Candidatus Aminicenantes bacterium]NIM83036.1 hypothetical protein [Candidatus Aminicenantes bacterium]NIN22424.1 hypothetical protein [Candidatus Aminicenantes bacterium]NIN46192.1 hypothetical protein [Candidatus Aminicenantes bacterium]NIN89029.1 hypothetical protein [Candidatus Aminicenantes bacterium]
MDIEIISSYYGAISRIMDSEYHISVIGEDGKLLGDDWKEMCRRTANNGASGMREMPFWLEKQQDHIFAPYIFTDGKFDLNQFNPLYFENLRKMVDIANSYNLKFYFSLYEACNIKERYGKRDFVPWTNNVQGLRNAWYKRDADDYREAWENKILETFEGKNVGYELCNEPLDMDFQHSGFETYKRLISRDVPDEDIVMGVEWDTREYRNFREPFLETYHDHWWNKQKHKWFSTVHNLSAKTFEKLSLQEGHTRRFWLSADGWHPKPNQIWWENSLRDFFRTVPTAPFKNKYAFETMHKKDEDDFDDARGISEIINEVTGSYPPNFDKFKDDGGNGGDGGRGPRRRRHEDRERGPRRRRR